MFAKRNRHPWGARDLVLAGASKVRSAADLGQPRMARMGHPENRKPLALLGEAGAERRRYPV